MGVLGAVDRSVSAEEEGEKMTKQTAAKSKYRNVRTNGFASKKEAKRYQELKLLAKAGEICELECQVRFPIKINDILVCTYVADFVYIERHGQVVEDVKGMRTPIYNLKKRLMEAVHDIIIKEV